MNGCHIVRIEMVSSFNGMCPPLRFGLAVSFVGILWFGIDGR